MRKSFYLFLFLFSAGVVTVLFNACQPFDSSGPFSKSQSSNSSRNPIAKKIFIETYISNQLKNKFYTLVKTKLSHEIHLVDYVDTMKSILSEYYDTTVTSDIVEIDGRSLVTEYDNFMFRRRMFSFKIGGAHNIPVAYLAFSPLSNEFEIIVWDDFTKRYEFLDVKNVYTRTKAATLNINFSNRNTCLICHQNGGAIFPRAPWGETHFLRNTAEQFTHGDTLAKAKDPELIEFLTKDMPLIIDKNEVEKGRRVTISSFAKTIQSFDKSVRITSTVNSMQSFVSQYCLYNDQKCKSEVLGYMINATPSLTPSPSKEKTQALRSSVLPDVVPGENTGVLLPTKTITEGMVLNEEFEKTFTSNPLTFSLAVLTQISGLTSILPTGQPNPLLPSTLRPATDKINEYQAFAQLKANQNLLLLIFGFNKSDLNALGDFHERKEFLEHLAKVKHWPLNRQLFKKYAQRFLAGNFQIDEEILPLAYTKQTDLEIGSIGNEHNNKEENTASISNQSHVTLIRTCQSCHKSDSIYPIDFYSVDVLKNYRLQNPSFGNSIKDTIDKNTMPPQNTQSDITVFQEEKESILNFLNSL